MKSYPKLTYYDDADIGKYCYAFDKLDGSNIRCEWNRKRGWYKFGTRNTMIGDTNHDFYPAIDIFMNKYSDDLERVFRNKKDYRNSESFVIFMEYHGENSFAGFHHEDDEMDCVLFDISQYKKGMTPPSEFIKNFGHLHIPNIIFQGQLTYNFIEDVKSNRFGLVEGVMAKGSDNKSIWMKKIKTREWIESVKQKMGIQYIIEDCNNKIESL
jgi:hypothetical protein